ncbi:hypothetical protein CIHG_05396 [Coccidioides immitis H538.4]|nr:hypothetical protein CIRG_02186 [Coccidioides immitis RMSCC 2394]KMU81565.1 hypothetical protein CISG_09297 [Coccidioides immitis RMSCC 3703]KMU88226.1 hypothetical protein CIHG_05396 [Coccidioides immitis H538.4]
MDLSDDQCGRIVYPRDPHGILISELPLMGHFVQRGEGLAPVLTFPVNRDHPIVARWREVAREIIAKLDNARLKWAGVECFQRRQLQQKRKNFDDTTVVITLEKLPSSSFDKKKLLEDIHMLSGGLFVELIEGRICPGYHYRELPPKTGYELQPSMGASIGSIASSEVTGTLGGYVELFKAGAPDRICALTCGHIGMAYEEDVSSDDDFTGPFTMIEDSPIPIGHPSFGDHNAMIEVYERGIKLYEDFEREQEKKVRVDSGNLRAIEALSYTRRMAAVYRQKLASAKDADRNIGNLFAASGYQVSESGCLLDWALIDLNPGRIGVNRCREGFVQSVAPGFDSGSRVVKIGRSSDYTVGYLNGVESYLTFRNTQLEVTLAEWAVVAASTHPFCARGDSGSFVLNDADDLIGLLWGVRETGISHRLDAGYITPFREVAKHIQEVTGYQVRLPKIDRPEEDGFNRL